MKSEVCFISEVWTQILFVENIINSYLIPFSNIFNIRRKVWHCYLVCFITYLSSPRSIEFKCLYYLQTGDCTSYFKRIDSISKRVGRSSWSPENLDSSEMLLLCTNLVKVFNFLLVYWVFNIYSVNEN